MNLWRHRTSRSKTTPDPISAVRVLILITLSIASPQAEARQPVDDQALHEIEAEMLAEINRLRRDPTAYAETVLVPLTATLRRVPEDEKQPYRGGRISFSDHPLDKLLIAEGSQFEDAEAVLDEAVAALRATPALPELNRNAVLDAAARWYSRDLQGAGSKRPPHVDSLGRGPGRRIVHFGTSEQAMRQWHKLVDRLGPLRTTTLYGFEQDEVFYLVDLPAKGGYRYRSVDGGTAKFIKQHGMESEIPRLDRPGWKLTAMVEVASRSLRSGDASMAFPMPRPTLGENIVWGPWSRRLAARGLVCWWIIDPGIPGRGHRQTLLDPEFRHCGIGLSWSPEKGYVATFDTAAETLIKWNNHASRAETRQE